ncbi:hypothetical protein E3A20_29960 [Planctomyces bekefii]|uniref:Lipoprotein n=1 Tax=Planctomyces bekefii TaxID=1653850 RepID=A0A5C6M149_9PLAN|nr:hypothetical protein E3A20_29960 [Planctomyces bekefii]
MFSRFFAKAALGLVILALGGCTYSIHQLYVSPMDPKAVYGAGGHWLEVETSDFVILGFATQTNYVEDAFRKLEAKCPGRISQVTTEHLTAYKFLSYDQKVVLKGYCQT